MLLENKFVTILINMKLENRVMEKTDFEDFALPLVQSLALFIKTKRSLMKVEVKKDSSLVTNLDKEVELKLREAFSQKYQDLNIVGEEFEDKKGTSEYSLYIDPIDGTSAFVSKGYDYAISLGVLKNGIPHYGLVYDVANDFYYMNGETNAKLNSSNELYIQGNPKIQRLNFSDLIIKYSPGFATALGLIRPSSGSIRSYIQTSKNIKKWDFIGALGHLKYCDHIEIDFLQEGVSMDTNFLEKKEVIGLISYRKDDSKFEHWYSQNKKNLQKLI